MSEKDIIKEYVENIYILDTYGFLEFKKFIEEQKNNLSISQLTIASSIIAVFDMLEKIEKK